jgi:hypothetical protein
MIPIIAKRVLGAIPAKAKAMISLTIIMIVVATYAYWKVLHLQNELVNCEAERIRLESQLTLKDSHILNLKSVVRQQNERVAVMKDITELRNQEIRDAENSIQKMRERSGGKVRQLKREAGSSCSDGINLLDKELGLS